MGGGGLPQLETTEPASAPGPEPVAPPLGFPARVTGIFFSPQEIFAEIACRPCFVAPLLLLIGFALALTVTISQRVGAEQILRKQFERSPRTADLPAERREELIERAMPFVRYSMYLGALLILPITVLAISGTLLAMANFFLGAEARFAAMLAVTAHGLLPGCVAALLGIIILFLKDPAEVDVQNIVMANLSPLFDPVSHKVLYRPGSSLDLFSLWQVALLATGVAAAARLSFRKGLVAVGVPWVLWVLGVAGWTAIF